MYRKAASLSLHRRIVLLFMVDFDVTVIGNLCLHRAQYCCNTFDLKNLVTQHGVPVIHARHIMGH